MSLPIRELGSKVWTPVTVGDVVRKLCETLPEVWWWVQEHHSSDSFSITLRAKDRYVQADISRMELYEAIRPLELIAYLMDEMIWKLTLDQRSEFQNRDRVRVSDRFDHTSVVPSAPLVKRRRAIRFE